MSSSKNAFWSLCFSFICCLLLGLGCDDPQPGPIGGVVLVIRSHASTREAISKIAYIEIKTEKIDVKISRMTGESTLTVDTHMRTIRIDNTEANDWLVGQYQVPVGQVSQIRIFPKEVIVHLSDGSAVSLDEPGSTPSWKQSGWKLIPKSENSWPVKFDELIGVRVQFEFDDQVLYNKGIGYKLKPTCPGESFAPNPAANQPGVYIDQLVVSFKRDIARAQVDSILRVIGATILREPALSITNLYHIKLPPATNIQDGYNYLASRAEVDAILPALSYSLLDVNPSEGTRICQAQVNLPQAWGYVTSGRGFPVGSRRIKVAVIDSGFAIAHPDLYLNIAINSGEIPAMIRSQIKDVDNDGIITFIDLNNSQNAAVAPPDYNNNRLIDGADLLDPRSGWLNGVDDDVNGAKDDLVGYNFAEKRPDPSTNQAYHGTQVAGIIGAIGNNATGAAGTIWEVSLVPIQIIAPGAQGSTPAALEEALAYAEIIGADIVNISAGTLFGDKQAKPSCTSFLSNYNGNNSSEAFSAALQSYDKFFRKEPWLVNGHIESRALYIFGAGNHGVNLDNTNLRLIPAQPMKTVMPGNVLLAGAFQTNRFISCQQSNFGTDVELFAPGGGYSFLIPPSGLIVAGDQDDCATSFAAPMIAGAAALILTAIPGLGPPSEIKARLLGGSPVRIANGACGIQPNNDIFRGLDVFSAVR